MKRPCDSVKTLLTSIFVVCLLAAAPSETSASPHCLGGSSAIAKRAVQPSSPSPTGIKSDRNDAEDCHALPWFDSYIAIAADTAYSGYAYLLHREPSPLWNPEAGYGRSPPSYDCSSQL